MPAQRPSAAFEPISPDLDVANLVETTPNFEYVVRIHCDMIDVQGKDQFEKLVLLHVVLGGKPLVVEGYHERLDRWTFALQWLRDNCATKIENARDLTKKSNLPLTVGHYLNNMQILTNQWSPHNYKDPNRQRIYLKDIDCPQLWHEKLSELIPQGLFYLNESTGEPGGLGSVDEPEPHGTGVRKGRGIAKAGDLMSSLPSEMRAENMMCYIGHEGTYTPAHREMCASLGQNIMVETSTGTTEDGIPTKPGSSIWFMTETKDRHLVSEYWLSRLGHDIEVENHFAQVNAWKAAPFKVYVVEQRVGDFILIPPLAPHQVWNRGTRTMKAAWNRTTVETLELAFNEALPASRMVCRDEQYKNKAVVYFTLVKYSKLIKAADKERRRIAKIQNGLASFPSKIRQLHKDFKRLHGLFTRVMVSESFLPDTPEKSVELIPFESNITCSYCRCNIFNRFLTCPSCIGDLGNGEEDTYDVCMECYAMGRSCACISKLRWVQQFEWGDLVQKHDAWRHQIIQFEGEVNEKSPKALKVEIELFGRRTLAQICQLELKKRPWNDITKPPEKSDKKQRLSAIGDKSDEEIEVDDEGRVKKKKSKIRRTEKWIREHKSCHLCCYQEPTWKQAHCACGASYCYGSLFRGFDMVPQDILEDIDWKCPRCLKICSCSKCRKDPQNRPHAPSGTILGHDTRKVADPRSVESLVDFSYSNIHWLKKAGDDDPKNSHRLKKRRKAAEAAKAQDPSQDPRLGEFYVSEEDANILRLAEHEGISIDPALGPVDQGEDGAEGEETETSEDLENQYQEHPEQAWPADNFGPTPPEPQFVVPEGGIIRDVDQAYFPTDAITYDYPDPNGAVQNGTMFDAVTIPDPQAMGQSFIAGYEPAKPIGNGNIEMIAPKKRKRQSEGIITSKKSKSGNTQETSQTPKVLKPANIRKFRSKTDDKTIDGKPTLLVKLGVSRPALEEVARRVTERPSVPVQDAPKVASDLRALNASANRPEVVDAPPVKKAHIVRTEADDEFVVSKRRKRRSQIDAEIPVAGRKTRARVVEYISEPEDEEEDKDSLFTPQKPSRTRTRVVGKQRSVNSGGNNTANTQTSTPSQAVSSTKPSKSNATAPSIAAAPPTKIHSFASINTPNDNSDEEDEAEPEAQEDADTHHESENGNDNDNEALESQSDAKLELEAVPVLATNPAQHTKVGGKYPSLQPRAGRQSQAQSHAASNSRLYSSSSASPTSSRYATPSERGTPARTPLGPSATATAAASNSNSNNKGTITPLKNMRKADAEQIAANRKAKLAAWKGMDDLF